MIKARVPEYPALHTGEFREVYEPHEDTYLLLDALNAEKAEAKKNKELIRIRMVEACDALNIAYSFHEAGWKVERQVREVTQVSRPQHVRPLQAAGGLCTGYGVSAADMQVVNPPAATVRRSGPRPTLS